MSLNNQQIDDDIELVLTSIIGRDYSYPKDMGMIDINFFHSAQRIAERLKWTLATLREVAKSLARTNAQMRQCRLLRTNCGADITEGGCTCEGAVDCRFISDISPWREHSNLFPDYIQYYTWLVTE